MMKMNDKKKQRITAVIDVVLNIAMVIGSIIPAMLF